MPPLYIIVMGIYTILTAFILYLVISNMLRAKNIWEQIMAIIVIVPFAMRLFFIK
jgi:cell shape-determining protein MreD